MKNYDPIRRKIIFRRLVLGTCLFYALMCLLIIVIPLSQTGEYSLTYEANLQDTVASIVPKNGYDIHYTTLSGFQSSRFYLKFALPGSDLSDFMQGFCPTMEMSDGGDMSLHDIYNIERLDWWKPVDAKIYSVGSCAEGKFEFYDILIDKSNADHFTVYVER